MKQHFLALFRSTSSFSLPHQAQERSLSSQIQQQALMLSSLVQGMQGLQLAVMQQVGQLSAGHAAEIQQVSQEPFCTSECSPSDAHMYYNEGVITLFASMQARHEISSEVVMMQRLRQEMEGQASVVRESQAAISRDVGAMREGLQAALTGFAGSIAAYGRTLAANGGGLVTGGRGGQVGSSADAMVSSPSGASSGTSGGRGNAMNQTVLPPLTGVKQASSTWPHGAHR